jgi:hypothetical protein
VPDTFVGLPGFGTSAVLDDTGGVVVATDSLTGRFTSDGILDRTFAPCVFTYNAFLTARALVHQPDGKLLVVGATFPGTLGMLRFTSDTPTCGVAAPRGAKLSSRPSQQDLSLPSPSLKWSWKSNDTVALSDLGNPLPHGGDSFTWCLFDAADPAGLRGPVFVLPGSGFQSGGETNWKTIRLGYKSTFHSHFTGTYTFRLRAGGPRQARMQLSARGERTRDLALPPYDPPITLRLDRSGSPFCWESQFSTPMRNLASGLTATSD